MTTKKGKELMLPFAEAAKKEGDPFFACHFSREEDQFLGLHDGLDMGDALILVNYLIDTFNIERILLANA
jgi:hypothetical protein